MWPQLQVEIKRVGSLSATFFGVYLHLLFYNVRVLPEIRRVYSLLQVVLT